MSVEESYLILLATIFIIYICSKLFRRKRAKKSIIHPVVNKIIENHENYIRLLTCLNHTGKEICLNLLFTYGYPRDKALFNKQLSLFRTQLLGGKKKILRDDQINLLFPINNETDYEKFDITLFYQVIRNCLPRLPAPFGGWKLPTPKLNDNTISANIVRLKNLRNKLSHSNGKITNDVFEDLWKELTTILTALNYDVQQIVKLKTCPLTSTTEYINAFTQAQVELCFDKFEEFSQYGAQIKLCENRIGATSDGLNILNRRMSYQEKTTNKYQEFLRDFETLRKEITSGSTEMLNMNVNSIYDSISQIEEKIDTGFDRILRHKDVINEMDTNDGPMKMFQTQERKVALVSKDRFLNEINMSNSTLTIDTMQNLCMVVCNAKSFILNKLVLRDCNLTNQHLKEISMAAPFLYEIDVGENTSISSNGLKHLSDAVSEQHSRLKRLSLDFCSTQDEDLSAISTLVTELEYLNLNWNECITSLGYKCLSSAIEKRGTWSELRELDISHCSLTDASLISLSPAVPYINKIILNNNHSITHYGYSKLSEVITECANYITEEINLCECNINNKKLHAISKFVPLLKTVNLSNNRSISSDGWKSLKDAIRERRYSKLNTLVIGGTFFQKNDIFELSEIMINTKNVKITNSQLDINGLDSFVKTVVNAEQCNLEEISFDACNLSLENLLILLPLYATKVMPNVFEEFIINNDEIKIFIERFTLDYPSFLYKLCDTQFRWKGDQIKHLLSVIPQLHCINLNASIQMSECALQQLKNVIIENRHHLPDELRYSYSDSNEHLLNNFADIGPYFTRVYLNGNSSITPLHLTRFFESSLEKNLFILEELFLNECNITDRHIEKISQLIPTLIHLDLSGNTEITSNGWKIIAKEFSAAPSNRLKKLTLSGCSVSCSDVSSFFQNRTLLEELVLSNNKTLEMNINNIDNKSCSLLNKLDLSDCNLRFLLMTHGSHKLCSVRNLCLDRNQGMSFASVKLFCECVLRSSPGQLETLSMRGCSLNDGHMEHLSVALPLMKEVDLSQNRAITFKGWNYLTNNILNVSTLYMDSLTVEDCNLTGSSLGAIFKIAPRLSELNLNNNQFIQPSDFKLLLRTVQAKSCIAGFKLCLQSCNLNDDHLKELSGSVPFITTLEIVDNHGITMKGLKYLNDSLCSSRYRQIKDIYIDTSCTDETFMSSLVESSNCFWWNLSNYSQKTTAGEKPCFIPIKFYLNTPTFAQVQSFCNLSAWACTFEMDAILTERVEAFSELESLDKLNVMKGGIIIFNNSYFVKNDLKSLAVFVNNLQTLNIYHSSIGLEGFKAVTKSMEDKCSISLLEVLSLSDCNLTDNHLHLLEPLIPILKQLDLTGNKYISPLAWKKFSKCYCCSEAPKLDILLLKNCNLTEEHVDNMACMIRNLTEISISDNFTLSWNAYGSLSKMFQSNLCSLERIDIRQSGMNDFYLKKAETFIFQLENLNLDGVYGITTSGYKSLSSFVSKSRINYLNTLNHSAAYIRDADMVYIGEMADVFEEINLSENAGLTDQGFKLFSDGFNRKSSEGALKLSILDLAACHLTDASMQNLECVVSQISVLILDYNKGISSTLLQTLCSAISTKQSRLRTLSLEGCCLQRQHLEALREGITYLSHLFLSKNNFSIPDCEYLSNMVCSCYPRDLRTLYLEYCGISDGHLEVMSDMVASQRCISLSNNKAITYVGLEKLSNQISTRENMMLEKLFLSGCNLTKHHLFALKDILTKIRIVTIYEDFLSTDVFTGFQPAFKTSSEVILEEIQFTHLQMSDLRVIDLFPFICHLKKLNLSNAVQLTKNSLDSLSGEILKSLSMRLETLILSNCDLTHDMMGILSKFVFRLRKLDLSHCRRISPVSLKDLVEFCKNSNDFKLEVLKIQNININKERLLSLRDLIPRLKKLNISFNSSLTSESFSILSDILLKSKSCSLEKLVIKECNLKEDHLKLICTFAHRLKTLILDQNKLMSYDGLKAFSNRIVEVKSSVLEKVSFCSCRLNDMHIRSISEMIPLVKEIDLSGNKGILKPGIKYISNVLEKSVDPKIQKIHLENCNINCYHMEALNGIIQKVKHLNIQRNYNWKVHDMKVLSNVLSRQPLKNIESLDLSNCNLNDLHLNIIASFVYHLKSLNLSKNGLFTANGFECLSTEICQSNCLEILNISNCHLNDEHITVAARFIPHLKEINLSKNRLITPSSLNAITDSISGVDQNRLEILNLHDCNLDDDCLFSILNVLPMIKLVVLSRNRNLTNERFESFLDDYKEICNGDTTMKKLDLDVTNAFVNSTFLKSNRWDDFVNIITDTKKVK